MSSVRAYSQRRPLGHGRIAANDAPVEPRDAATLIVWRDGTDGPEVLMGRRLRHAAFVPDFFVFPGGRLDPADHAVRPATPLTTAVVEQMSLFGDSSLAQALAIAAVRETFEETGLLLAESGDIGQAANSEWTYWKERGLAPDLSRLGYFGRAITSPISPIRYHARFFIVCAEALQGDIAGSGELDDLAFYPVAHVLANLPVVDVTELMLNRVVALAAAPHSFDSRTPVFSYEGERPFVRYEE